MNEDKRSPVISTLRLDGHCIACAVNRRAHDLIERLLCCEDKAVIEALNGELELLTRFHHETDFENLRTERPELTGSRLVDVTIRENGIGRFDISARMAKDEEHNGKDFA